MSDVVRACVSLRQQGRRLGPSNVRLELGRGSMTTISRHLRRLALRDVHREFAAQERRHDSLENPGGGIKA
ncbi:DNA-binding protein [Ralstonia solanacearum]